MLSGLRKFFRRHGWMGTAVTWIVHGVNAYFYAGIVIAALIAWASTWWSWYWDTFSWAGPAIAFLVGYLTLAVGVVLFSLAAVLFTKKSLTPKDIVSELGGAGAIEWYSNLTLEGGNRIPVYSLRFYGRNKSVAEVELKDAYITSAINGSKITLEVVAMNQQGQSEIVPLERIELIPPGAPIELVAKFNPPDGLATAGFVATWGALFFNAIDAERSYRHEVSEKQLAGFFPGRLGPRVTQKVTAANAKPAI